MTSSACTKFLSHPIHEKKHLLIEHLIEVAEKSEEIFSQTLFRNPKLAFYSGLLHDFGKINPFYQTVFHGTTTEKEAESTYAHEHSIFSAWAAQRLLYKTGLERDLIDKISVLIYGHHSKIRQQLGKNSRNEQKIKKSRDEIAMQMDEFSLQASKKPGFSKLNWDSGKRRFCRPIDFDLKLKSENSPDDYLEMAYAFSCLLQADRGSFNDWIVPRFNLQFNTEKLRNASSPLAKLRTDFQSQVMDNFDYMQNISIINAPTGIGKTKVFLDIINHYSKRKDVERVFYFSPLLALTEDFEEKILEVSEQSQLNDILIYNHLHSTSLEDKHVDGMLGRINQWVFENESFNKKFVITTTQRLLMTIYSNRAQDKMKMASFRNSILIVDEIQTIPKPILSNLKNIFEKMSQYMKTKFILVSATIPHEISDVARVKISEETIDSYLDLTKKHVSVVDSLDIKTIPVDNTLVMANTRKKAVRLYNEISQANRGKKIEYISTGVRKKDRINLIKDLPKMSDYVLVATQVVEAGVDIDFSHVFREMAPLDNIIQVMGRLNRQGNNPNATLVVYSTEGNSHVPYSQLEFQESEKRVCGMVNSVQIYDALKEYYEEISKRNQININNSSKLEHLVSEMDFENVWDFVRKLISEKDNRDTVIVPDMDEWDSVRNKLLGIAETKKPQGIVKRFGEMTAMLPIPLEKVGTELFDDELMEKNILLPKKQHLQKIYHKKMGLDWHLVDDSSEDSTITYGKL